MMTTPLSDPDDAEDLQPLAAVIRECVIRNPAGEWVDGGDDPDMVCFRDTIVERWGQLAWRIAIAEADRGGVLESGTAHGEDYLFYSREAEENDDPD